MNMDKLIEFYNNNKNTIDLIAATALISSLITWLFTKLLPGISQSANKISEKIIQKIGGQLAYRHIQGKYLNWVVLHNQDLNLTGIIGTGQKPMLEQVFISLKVTKEKKLEENQSDNKPKKTIPSNTGKIKLWLSSFIRTTSEQFSKLFGEKEKEDQPQSSFFRAEKNWKLRQLSSRDHIGEIFIFIGFILTPLLILVLQSKFENLLSSLLYFILSVPILAGITRYRNNNENYSLLFYTITPLLLISVKLGWLIFYNASTLFLIIGTFAGALFFFFIIRDDIFPSKHKDDRPAREIGNLLSSSDNIAILGKPGSGKSTYAQFIALTFAQENASNKKQKRPGIVKRRFNINEWYLPILIPLRKVSKFITPSTIHSDKNLCIEAFKQDVLPANVREIFSDSFIRYMLNKGKCILLLDGLDEVSNEEHFRLIVNEIKGMVSQYPKNKFLITSRHAGWRGGIGSAFQTSEVNELNDDQISTFAYSWYESIELNRQSENSKIDDDEKLFREDRARAKAEQLVEAVDENENIRNLARNPLLLSMICYVHYNKTLPKERLSLYEDCSRLLLEQWDIEKGLPQDDIPLKYAQKEIIVQEIAYVMHSGKTHNGLGIREITSDEIISVIKNVISGFNLDPNQAEMFFKKLIERTGLIISTEQYKNLYGFSHLTFQEFYTAKFLSRNNMNIFVEIDSKKPESHEKLSSWWREVIILQGGMIKDISDIIKNLCCDSEQDYLGYRLQIAAQCLMDSTETPNTEAESILLRELLRIRSLGKINTNTANINSFGRKYLLNLASKSEFYDYSLHTRANDLLNQEDANSFATELLKLIDSPNLDVSFAAITALLSIAESYNISNHLSLETIKKIIIKVEGSPVLISMFELIDKKGIIINDDIRNAISDNCIKVLCDELVADSLTDDLSFCNILTWVGQKSFITNKLETKEYVFNTLSKIFKSIPSYRDSYNAFKSPLKNFIVCLFRFVLLLDETEAEKEFIKFQLLDMTHKGTANQCSWATLILGELFKSDKKIIEAILDLLNSPNSIVRLSAITALRNLELGTEDIDSIKSKYIKAVASKNKFNEFVAFTREIVFGRGSVGATTSERIQIAGSLLAMDNSLGIQQMIQYQSWADIYDYKYEWEEMLRDTNWALSDSDIERISTDLLKILSDPNNSIDFIDNIFQRSNKIHEQLKNKIFNYLYDDPHSGAINFLSTFNPIIEMDSREYDVIKNSLIKDYWSDADGAYDILEENKLIEKTFFE